MSVARPQLDKSFPFELRLINHILLRPRMARLILVLGLMLHLGSLLHSLNGKYALYSRASQLRNDIVIFVNTVSDLLMVAVNVLALIHMLRSPFLLELFAFCTTPMPILPSAGAARFSAWINLLRFGPLLPIFIGTWLFSRNAGWAAYQFFVGRQVWYYVMNVCTCTFICVVLQLKCEFARVNDFLAAALPSAAQLQLLSGHFNALCNLLDKFNQTFKALMVMAVMCVTGSVLHNCTSLIEYAAKPKGFNIKVATFLTQPLFVLATVPFKGQSLPLAMMLPVCAPFPEVRIFLLLRRHRPFYRGIQVALILAHLCLFAYAMGGKSLVYARLPPFGHPMVTVAAFLNDLVVLAQCVFAILSTTRTSALADLLSTVLRERPMRHQRLLHVYVALLRVLPLAPISVGVWLYWDLYRYLVHRDFCYFSLNLTVYTCAGLLQQISGSFAALNDRLERFGARQLKGLQWRCALNEAAKMRSHFSALYRLLDTFNSYVKGLLVIVVMSVCINILFNLTVITQFAIKPMGHPTNLQVYLIHALFILMSVGQAAVAAFVGEGLEEEGERTTRICFTLISQLNSSGKAEPLVGRELHFILEHSRARKICLHAGGFFRLNWGILGSIASTVATYSIVIIQFLLK